MLTALQPCSLSKADKRQHSGYGFVIFKDTVGSQRLLQAYSLKRVRLDGQEIDCKPFGSRNATA
jgi:hypothetical protein